MRIGARFIPSLIATCTLSYLCGIGARLRQRKGNVRNLAGSPPVHGSSRR